MRGKLYDKYCNLKKHINQINTPKDKIILPQSIDDDTLIDTGFLY